MTKLIMIVVAITVLFGAYGFFTAKSAVTTVHAKQTSQLEQVMAE